MKTHQPPHTASAVVAGHICLDIIPAMQAIPSGKFMTLFQPGHLIEVGPATLSTGGAVSNTGLALHHLGIPTRLIGKIGEDVFGEAVQDIIRAYAPDLAEGIVTDSKSSTSYTVIINPPGIDRIFLYNSGANNTFCTADIDLDLISQAHLFHFGYPPTMQRMYENRGRELVKMFQQIKDTGATTSLDTSLPDPASDAGWANWSDILKATLPYVDIFSPSIEELLFMLRRSTYEAMRIASDEGDILDQITPDLLTDLGQTLIKLGVKIVAIKLGHAGLYMRTASPKAIQHMGRAAPSDVQSWAEQEVWAPCFQVNVVGTTGAGDATIAGFLGALLRDMSPYDAITAAVAVGACNVEAADALSGLRTWEETWQRVESGWARHSMDLSEAGWQFDTHHQLWYSILLPYDEIVETAGGNGSSP